MMPAIDSQGIEQPVFGSRLWADDTRLTRVDLIRLEAVAPGRFCLNN